MDIPFSSYLLMQIHIRHATSHVVPLPTKGPSTQSPHLVMHSIFLMLFSIPQTGFYFNVVVQFFWIEAYPFHHFSIVIYTVFKN